MSHRSNWSQITVSTVALSTFLFLATANLAVAVPVSDGSIFFEDFDVDGSLSGDPQWDFVSGTLTKASSILSINGTGNSYAHSNVLNFTSTPNQWVAEVRFQVDGTLDTTTSPNMRQFNLLSGVDSVTGTFEVFSFDLRLVEIATDPTGIGSTFNLEWFGFDGPNASRSSSSIAGGAGLNKNQFYEISLLRTPSDTIQIWLDGTLIDTKSLIVGAQTGNVGQENPDRLVLGAISSVITANVEWDYISVGAVVPEPAGTQLALAGLTAVGIAWRRRAR